MRRVRVGLEVLLENLEPLRGRRIGVVTNHTGVTPDFRHIVDLLVREGLNVVALLAPEHGVRGDLPAGARVEGYVDPRTGIPVYSLYGASHKPPASVMRKLDVVIYDIQDVGARFYTYISTLYYVLESAGEHGVRVLVLDRPNPITGSRVEGPVLEPGYRSFVGIWPLPVRYGLTPGELAELFNEEAGLGAELEVVKMEGWRRGMWFEDTGLPWVPPSPNMPTPNTAVVYPGTCLLEGTNVSEGRGTAKPFELLGAPWIDEYRLVEELETLPVRGAAFRPATFIPWAGKYIGEVCRGVQVYVTDREELDPVKMGLLLVWAIRRTHPGKLRFTESGGRYYFDLLIGCGEAREMVERGCEPEELLELCKRGLASFEEVRRRHLLYP
ncbi:MAG: DUF1343 domain-containing protein [Thermoproteales archaeon]|nr:DUF1343 domain-containing protein [Thermoproteales archaeon]